MEEAVQKDMMKATWIRKRDESKKYKLGQLSWLLFRGKGKGVG